MFVIGPGKGGPHAPYDKSVLNHSNSFCILKIYQQSERIDLYQSFADKLIKVLSHLILIYSLLMPLFESQDMPTVVFAHQIP